jgi:hypothetical protein
MQLISQVEFCSSISLLFFIENTCEITKLEAQNAISDTNTNVFKYVNISITAEIRKNIAVSKKGEISMLNITYFHHFSKLVRAPK